MNVHCHQLVHHIATNLWTYQGFGQFGVPGVCETFTFSPPYGCVCGRSWVVLSHPKEFMNCCAIPECSANCIASQRVAQHGYALQHHWKKLTLATPVCCNLPSGSSSSSVFESTKQIYQHWILQTFGTTYCLVGSIVATRAPESSIRVAQTATRWRLLLKSLSKPSAPIK